MFLAPIIMAAAVTGAPADWARMTHPAGEQVQSIGEYSNGCIAGAVSADLKNPYYQVIRQQNRRFYGHPVLVSYIGDLADRAHEAGLPILLVGDMAMPRGGRFIKGHASHQTGLDVDIWFRMVKKPLGKKDLEKPWALTIVKDNFLETNGYYSKDIYTLVKLAATDDRVARIFINPAIKNQLCRDTPEEERGWLHKIRPWWGHTAHIHVRLECPEGADSCVKQAPIPEGDGCGTELQSWLDEIRHPKKKDTKPKPKVKKIVPEQCIQLLQMN
ncbi:penicillin-insensitive murein endopeptidase [Ruminobacter amylophilus]|jgi:penicillin-insensitive murein endopeptidase|uniref:Penicillin-insensitive murein endopeptidase n=1 Tax=Ruminobacter amylophilus TaxID=867 RepID=A0A662ZEU4_9GAMM|nr:MULTISPECIES: penicillin-insensitive murein endopeptidase [Ruminobacter]SFP06447.1 penicillin-insensitive murein endopeptidase [Ruminobacter amylophilus]